MKTLLVFFAVLISTAASAQSPYYNQGRWRGHGGGDLGGAIVGGVIGGIIGGVLAPRAYYPPPQPYYQPQPVDPIEYCIRQFRSYNPETGFYLAYSGQYRRCP